MWKQWYVGLIDDEFVYVMEVELLFNFGVEVYCYVLFRVGWEGEKIIEDEVCKMEFVGIIRKLNLLWVFRVVLVIKKDGFVCFCVDYCDVNFKFCLEDSFFFFMVEVIDWLLFG